MNKAWDNNKLDEHSKFNMIVKNVCDYFVFICLVIAFLLEKAYVLINR